MNLSFSSLVSRSVLLATCLAGAGYSQTVNLNLNSDGTATPQSLNLTLASTVGAEPSGVQFLLAYPSSVSNLTVSAGPSATAAGKSVTCAGGSGTKKCVITGSTSASMTNGVVAVVGWGSAVVTGSTLASFQSNTGAAVSPDGSRLPTIVQTSISTPSVPPAAVIALRSLSCNGTQVSPTSSTVCTAALSSAAPAEGAAVLLSSSSPVLSVPGQVVVAAGMVQASFTATQTGVAASSASSGVITAAYGGQSLTASLKLATSTGGSAGGVQIQSLSCKTSQLTLRSSTECTIKLNANTSGNVLVSLASSNPALSVPSGIVLAPGTSQGAFLVTQSALSTSSAALIATLASQTASTKITLASR